MTWIQMRSGRAPDLDNPSASDIDAPELALLLSRLGRWGNHTNPEYSVAEHSVRVSQLVGAMATAAYGIELVALDLALAGLLHDGHEGPLGLDATRPLKYFIGEALKPLADAWDWAIAEHFKVDVALLKHPLVKLADDIVLSTERRDLMGPCDREWEWEPPPPLPAIIVPRSREESRAWFLQELSRIQAARRSLEEFMKGKVT